MKKIKWGILGCANIARKAVIPGILGADNSELYAVASRSKEKAADFAEEFGAAVYYDDYDKLLADEEIEAVYIPLPNGCIRNGPLRQQKQAKIFYVKNHFPVKAKKRQKRCLQQLRKTGLN